MSAYQPYPEYKPSGVEWLGDVPEGWILRRSKFLFKKRAEEPMPHDGIVTAFRDGQVTLRTNRRTDGFTNALQEIGYQRVHEGDLVVHAMDAFAGAIGISEATGKCSPVCSVCTPWTPHEFLMGYYGSLLRSMALSGFVESLAKGIRERSTDFRFADFKELWLPLPPLPEQRQIAAFLDRECGKLDALQAKQERLIELLKEKRQALISHAVTRGPNPAAKLKHSGVEWLGEVPGHWTTPQLKFLIVGIDQGKSPECEARMAEPNEWGVMKSGCVNWGIFREQEHKALPPHIAPIPTTEIRKGDLLMSRASGSTDLIGSVAYVENVRPRLMLSDKVFRLKSGKGCDPRFIWRMAGTIPVRQQIELSINGAEGLANNITKESIRSLFFTLPPLAEQRAIVAHLDEKCGKIDRLKAKAERAIELLKERRSALISAAVTGKIDVRKA